MVYILLGDGFEEIEATASYDILRRGGVDAVFAGIAGRRVISSHGIEYTAHCTVGDIDLGAAEMIVVPGGLGGVECIEASRETLDIIKSAHERGIEIAAICAGPRVLSHLGILRGKRATCYPGLETQLDAGEMLPRLSTVRDGRLTTGRGPGASMDFGFALLEALRGKAAADAVSAEMYWEHR